MDRKVLYDLEGNLLGESQIRSILKYFNEVDKRWHTREWFMNFLRRGGGEDPQVVRFVLNNVEWRMDGFGQVYPHVKSDFIRAVEAFDLEQYPEIEIGIDYIDYVEKKCRNDLAKGNPCPPHLLRLLESFRNKYYILQLDERNQEPRAEIHQLKQVLENLYAEIKLIMEPVEIIETNLLEEEPVAPASPHSAMILSCAECGNEDFSWLEPAERVDVVEISDDPEIARLQHDLRHQILALLDARNRKRPFNYIMNIEDEIEDIHMRIEKLKRRSNPYFYY